MDRLTEYEIVGGQKHAIPNCDADKAIQRLAAYEDTGLMPGEIPHWIPVSKRLPKVDGTYIVYAPTYSGGSSSGLDCISGIMFCRFKHGKWSIEHGYYSRPNCVTHWMPLPQPPKESSKLIADDLIPTNVPDSAWQPTKKEN